MPYYRVPYYSVLYYKVPYYRVLTASILRVDCCSPFQHLSQRESPSTSCCNMLWALTTRPFSPCAVASLDRMRALQARTLRLHLHAPLKCLLVTRRQPEAHKKPSVFRAVGFNLQQQSAYQHHCWQHQHHCWQHQHHCWQHQHHCWQHQHHCWQHQHHCWQHQHYLSQRRIRNFCMGMWESSSFEQGTG